jgi:hypothetical protein
MTITDDPRLWIELEPVSLEELTAAADLQTRRDRKYLVPREAVPDLLADGAPSMRVLTIGDVRRFRYESVYFDTPDLASYLGAARRRPRRFKVRTRTYVDSEASVLEVKVRDARGRNVKHRLPYPFDDRGEVTGAGKTFVASIPEAADAVDRLAPTLTTSYRRTTLLLAGTAARVTVDVALAWRAAGGDTSALSDVALIETKTCGPPCAIDRALWRAGHRPVSISKYATGLAMLHPHLPAHPWNRLLRHQCGWTPA